MDMEYINMDYMDSKISITVNMIVDNNYMNKRSYSLNI